MNAFILKELKESGRWAIIMMVSLIGVMSVPLYWAANRYSSHTISDWEFLAIAMIGFPAIGVILAMIQIAQDWPAGRWAFVTHRPISRAKIFAAKAIAGLILYTLAVAVPLVCAILWAAVRVRLKLPFDWHMAIPGIAMGFHGLVWYFAALLVATRDANWLLTRIIPFGGAVLVSMVAIMLTVTYAEVFLTIFAGLALIAIAAQASFSSGGGFARQPAIARLIHSTMLGAGMLMLVLLTAAGIRNAAWYFTPRKSIPYSYSSEGYQINADGIVLKITYQSGMRTSITDLEGNPVAGADPDMLEHEPYLARYGSHGSFLSTSGPGGDDNPQIRQRGRMQLWNRGSYFVQLGGGDKWAWYYLPGRRTIEGVDVETGERTGSIGPDGFTDALNPPKPFPSRLTVLRFPLLWDDKALYQIVLDNPKQPSIRKLMAISAGEAIRDAVLLAPEDRRTGQPTAFVLTASTLHGFRSGAEIFSLPIASELKDYWGLSITPTPQGTFVLHFQQSYVYGPPPQVVMEVSDSGQILKRTELPLLKYSSTTPTSSAPWYEFTHVLAAPPVWTFNGLVRWVIAAKRLGANVSGVWLLPIATMVLSLACAGIILLIRRRCQLDRNATILWSIVSFLLGIAGVLTLLAVRGFPIRVVCPNCRKRRAINRETCEHCGAAFEQPRMTGIEVFE